MLNARRYDRSVKGGHRGWSALVKRCEINEGALEHHHEFISGDKFVEPQHIVFDSKGSSLLHQILHQLACTQQHTAAQSQYSVLSLAF